MIGIKLFVAIALIGTAYAQTCTLTNVVNVGGQHVYQQQSTAGFCRELVVGPVSSTMSLLLQWVQVSVSCTAGDKLELYTPERTLLYDYCSQKTITYLMHENKYVILRLSSSTSSILTIIFNFYLSQPSGTTTLAPTTTTTVATTTTAATAVNSTGCGVPAITPNESILRIVGGIESVKNSWPWQAFLTDGSFLCGASLIDNEWLVTAAHCIYGMTTGSLRVYLGTHTLSKMEPTTVVRYVTRIIQHPSYNPQTLDNDIALLKISPVTYTKEISPICLPKQGDNLAVSPKVGIVTGWGKISGNGATSDVLRQTTITVQTCSFYAPNMICAGQQAPSTVHDSCNGDSGGPFMIKSGGSYVLSGIVSWGGADCAGDGVYTKVSNYVDWINAVKKTY